MEILAPSPEFYPNITQLNATLKDRKESRQRFEWRTKQNLDYAFLMFHAFGRGHFYVQLEDDVVTRDGYFSFFMTQAVSHTPAGWFMMSFSPYGFIGKMFRQRELGLVAHFLFRQHDAKPCDWLIEDLIQQHVCGMTQHLHAT